MKAVIITSRDTGRVSRVALCLGNEPGLAHLDALTPSHLLVTVKEITELSVLVSYLREELDVELAEP